MHLFSKCPAALEFDDGDRQWILLESTSSHTARNQSSWSSSSRSCIMLTMRLLWPVPRLDCSGASTLSQVHTFAPVCRWTPVRPRYWHSWHSREWSRTLLCLALATQLSTIRGTLSQCPFGGLPEVEFQRPPQSIAEKGRPGGDWCEQTALSQRLCCRGSLFHCVVWRCCWGASTSESPTCSGGKWRSRVWRMQNVLCVSLGLS